MNERWGLRNGDGDLSKNYDMARGIEEYRVSLEISIDFSLFPLKILTMTMVVVVL